MYLTLLIGLIETDVEIDNCVEFCTENPFTLQ